MNESDEHAILVELFRRHPELILRLVADTPGLTIPKESRACAVDPIVQLDPLAPDVIIELRAPDGRPLVVFILEAQRFAKTDKLLKWPAMLWNERYRRGCDCHLVVLTTSRRVAAWAARPIRCGDSVTHLLVRGPDQIPRITDPIVAAATPELAVLSASIHGADPGGREVVETALSVLPSLPPSEARMYNLFIHRALSVAAIERLHEEIMYFSDMKEMVDNWKFDEHGMPLSGYEVLIKPMLIEERRRFILDAVTARGLGDSDEIRARVDGCVDVEVLRRWAHQALTARTADEIFAA